MERESAQGAEINFKTRQRRAESAHALNRTARWVWVPPTQTGLHGLPWRVGYTLISPLRRASPVLSDRRSPDGNPAGGRAMASNLVAQDDYVTPRG
jgi:hypothetical protein